MKWIVTNQHDGNDTFEAEGNSYSEAAGDALNQLGWAISIPDEAACCFCKVDDADVETATTGTLMHRKCLQEAGLGSLESSILPKNIFLDYSLEEKMS